MRPTCTTQPFPLWTLTGGTWGANHWTPMHRGTPLHETQCGSPVHFCMVNSGHEKRGDAMPVQCSAAFSIWGVLRLANSSELRKSRRSIQISRSMKKKASKSHMNLDAVVLTRHIWLGRFQMPASTWSVGRSNVMSLKTRCPRLKIQTPGLADSPSIMVLICSIMNGVSRKEGVTA